MARPTKRTAERQQKILDALRAGNYLETAATYAGVHRDTLNEWRKKFPGFSDAVDEARASAEAKNVAIIQRAAELHWQAAAWWLERSFPGRYGRRERIEHTGGEGGPVQVEINRPLSHERALELARLALELEPAHPDIDSLSVTATAATVGRLEG